MRGRAGDTAVPSRGAGAAGTREGPSCSAAAAHPRQLALSSLPFPPRKHQHVPTLCFSAWWEQQLPLSVPAQRSELLLKSFLFPPQSTTELLERGVGLKITCGVPCALFSHTRSAQQNRARRTDGRCLTAQGRHPEGTMLQMATREEKHTALPTCLGTKESSHLLLYVEYLQGNSAQHKKLRYIQRYGLNGPRRRG